MVLAKRSQTQKGSVGLNNRQEAGIPPWFLSSVLLTWPPQIRTLLAEATILALNIGKKLQYIFLLRIRMLVLGKKS